MYGPDKLSCKFLFLSEVKKSSLLFSKSFENFSLYFLKKSSTKLLISFNALINQGHTVIVVEHNLDLIKCADHIIDLGPEGGKNGGNLVSMGTPEKIMENKGSHTGRYLIKKMIN